MACRPMRGPAPHAAISIETPAVAPTSASATLVTPSAARRAAARANAATPSPAEGARHGPRDPAPGVRAPHDPRRLTRRVAIGNGAPRHVCAVATKTGHGEGQAVRHDRMTGHMGEEHRPVRHESVEVVARRVPGIVPPVGIVAGDEPRIRRQSLADPRHGPERRAPVVTGKEAHPGHHALPVRVGMGIHEPREHGTSAKVDDQRVRAREGQHLSVAADGQDPLVGIAQGRRPPARRVGRPVARRVRGAIGRQRAVEREHRSAVEDRVVVGHRAGV